MCVCSFCGFFGVRQLKGVVVHCNVDFVQQVGFFFILKINTKLWNLKFHSSLYIEKVTKVLEAMFNYCLGTSHPKSIYQLIIF